MSISSEIIRINEEVSTQTELIGEIINVLLTKVTGGNTASTTDADSAEE